MSRSIRRHRKAVAIVASFAAATLVGGVAWAYWTAGGAGTGKAQTAAVTAPLVVSQTADITGLAPGDTIALTGMVTNPNSTSIKLGVLTAAVTPAVPGVSITGTAVFVSPLVRKGTPVAWSGLALEYQDLNTNQDGDKNKALIITYTMAPFVEPTPAPPTTAPPTTAPPVIPLGTAQIIDVAGVKTFDIFINHVHFGGSTNERLFTAPTLSLRIKDAQLTQSAANGYGYLVDPESGLFLATPDAAGNLRYRGTAGGLVAGHVYTVTVYDSSTGYGWGIHPVNLSF